MTLVNNKVLAESQASFIIASAKVASEEITSIPTGTFKIQAKPSTDQVQADFLHSIIYSTASELEQSTLSGGREKEFNDRKTDRQEARRQEETDYYQHLEQLRAIDDRAISALQKTMRAVCAMMETQGQASPLMEILDNGDALLKSCLNQTETGSISSEISKYSADLIKISTRVLNALAVDNGPLKA